MIGYMSVTGEMRGEETTSGGVRDSFLVQATDVRYWTQRQSIVSVEYDRSCVKPASSSSLTP
jgi:hypothetical protein